MAPIHDTDVAKERWTQAEWRAFELWEKIEVNERRKKRIWVICAVIVFLAISAIPAWIENRPKWVTLAASRRLTATLSHLKARAAVEHQAFRLRFDEAGSLSYVIERVASCALKDATHSQVTERGQLLSDALSKDYLLLSRWDAQSVGVPGVEESFCYDPLHGVWSGVEDGAGRGLKGIGVISVKDLTEGRMDRASFTLFGTPLGQRLDGTPEEMTFH